MEVWKPISEYEGIYYVSNLGRVKNSKGLIMSQFKINSGYMSITLTRDKGRRNLLVHRLVAREFCEGYEEGLVVNHKDADRVNNRSENLEWITARENIHDMIVRGVHDYKSAHKVAQKRRRKPVRIESKCGTVIKEFESARAASYYIGTHENNVSRTARGDRKSTGGYFVEYL